MIKGDEQQKKSVLISSVEAPLRAEIKERTEKIESLRGEMHDWARENHVQKVEIERLRKRDEFLSKREKEKAGSRKGILDGDDF